MATLKLRNIVCAGWFLIVLNACGSTDVLLKPTGKAAFLPKDEVQFTQYVQNSRERIEQVLNELRPQSEYRPYRGGYTNQEAAEMRSPFQVPGDQSSRCTDISQGGGKGFLLIHGLTDSPYLMTSISDSLIKEYPCALIRAVLLPGHGTVAGDSLEMKHEDWAGITNYGVNSFVKDGSISDLYVIGFSTGTSLAINYMRENPGVSGKPRGDKIKGLVLLSTAVKANTSFAVLTQIAKMFKDWASTFEEKDAARYESFSMNAGAEFYKLTRDMLDSDYVIDVPVLMAVSADDETINARAAREFFCSTKINQGILVWYKSIDANVNTDIENTKKLVCDNIVDIDLADIDSRFKTLNLAHTALSMSPEDPHYGVDGKYRNCKRYDKKNKIEEFHCCQIDEENSVFGENNVADLKAKLNLNYKYLRRGTFNPDYNNLAAKILCFTSDTCAQSDILKVKTVH